MFTIYMVKIIRNFPSLYMTTLRPQDKSLIENNFS